MLLKHRHTTVKVAFSGQSWILIVHFPWSITVSLCLFTLVALFDNNTCFHPTPRQCAYWLNIISMADVPAMQWDVLWAKHSQDDNTLCRFEFVNFHAIWVNAFVSQCCYLSSFECLRYLLTIMLDRKCASGAFVERRSKLNTYCHLMFTSACTTYTYTPIWRSLRPPWW